MLPDNYISLLIADGRRAKQWELGLQRAGLRACLIQTSGSASGKGEYWLAVPRFEERRGQQYVSEVLAGRMALPSPAPIRGGLLWGAALIVGALLALLVAALVS